ncbi:MAG: hypothetical protein WAK33_20170 [Silvibacterium sp.]
MSRKRYFQTLGNLRGDSPDTRTRNHWTYIESGSVLRVAVGTEFPTGKGEGALVPYDQPRDPPLQMFVAFFANAADHAGFADCAGY